MKILSVHDNEFRRYGTVLEGYDFTDFVEVLRGTELPEDKVVYVPSFSPLERLAVSEKMGNNFYGGMPIQVGYCNGNNRSLNCLEYHRDAEINISVKNIILLVATLSDMENNRLNTGCVMAFSVPAKTAVQIYGTTLHYAPCNGESESGFQVSIVLPKGTNTKAPAITPCNDEDKLLWAKNKWLIAHPESTEAGEGAFVGLYGENLRV